jgi:VanZ family protein
MVLSLLPDPLLPLDWVSGMDKVQHWIAYTVLGALVYLTVQSPGYNRLFYVAVAVFSCTMYGGLIEVLQSFTGRTPDSIDFFVNMFGASVGSVAALGFVETSRDSRRRGTRISKRKTDTEGDRDAE